MNVLVSDTSVLIDLERTRLLVPAFGCGLTMIVPDWLYRTELETANGAYLMSLGLAVVDLTPAELTLTQEVRLERPGLSLPDAFALALATRPDHALLSGDGLLRRAATDRGLDVYGLLWLLDEMHARGVAPDLLYQGLSALNADARCRLPKAAIRERLLRWAPPPPDTTD
jgi:hypothetical protein